MQWEMLPSFLHGGKSPIFHAHAPEMATEDCGYSLKDFERLGQRDAEGGLVAVLTVKSLGNAFNAARQPSWKRVRVSKHFISSEMRLVSVVSDIPASWAIALSLRPAANNGSSSSVASVN